MSQGSLISRMALITYDGMSKSIKSGETSHSAQYRMDIHDFLAPATNKPRMGAGVGTGTALVGRTGGRCDGPPIRESMVFAEPQSVFTRTPVTEFKQWSDGGSPEIQRSAGRIRVEICRRGAIIWGHLCSLVRTTIRR